MFLIVIFKSSIHVYLVWFSAFIAASSSWKSMSLSHEFVESEEAGRFSEIGTAVGAVGTYPKLTVFWANNNFTGMTEWATQYLSWTPWAISSSAGTNSFVVGKARNATKLRVKDLIS